MTVGLPFWALIAVILAVAVVQILAHVEIYPWVHLFLAVCLMLRWWVVIVAVAPAVTLLMLAKKGLDETQQTANLASLAALCLLFQVYRPRWERFGVLGAFWLSMPVLLLARAVPTGGFECHILAVVCAAVALPLRFCNNKEARFVVLGSLWLLVVDPFCFLCVLPVIVCLNDKRAAWVALSWACICLAPTMLKLPVPSRVEIVGPVVRQCALHATLVMLVAAAHKLQDVWSDGCTAGLLSAVMAALPFYKLSQMTDWCLHAGFACVFVLRAGGQWRMPPTPVLVIAACGIYSLIDQIVDPWQTDSLYTTELHCARFPYLQPFGLREPSWQGCDAFALISSTMRVIAAIALASGTPYVIAVCVPLVASAAVFQMGSELYPYLAPPDQHSGFLLKVREALETAPRLLEPLHEGGYAPDLRSTMCALTAAVTLACVVWRLQAVRERWHVKATVVMTLLTVLCIVTELDVWLTGPLLTKPRDAFHCTLDLLLVFLLCVNALHPGPGPFSSVLWSGVMLVVTIKLGELGVIDERRNFIRP